MADSRPQNGVPKTGIEKMYQKKSQLEHILLRPDSYIGSVEKASDSMWVADKDPTTGEYSMVYREISFVPGLYKIFDEILVNAADNKQRDKSMSCIRIDINAEANTISVWNNGQGIPVVMHKDEKMYVPTMIFGHLLTSSNYDDEEEKVTGGRNGYGAKLCNIFSTKFTVETAAKQYKKCFRQTWADNMSKAAEPKIVDFGKGEDYTKVTFCPDLKKFKMDTLDDDIIALMSRRAFDVAASTRGVAVFLNGEKLAIKSFKDYIDLYLKDRQDHTGGPLKVVYENVNERWEVALTTSDRGFQQVSFVNSIATTKGGRHVDHVCDAITKQLTEILKKKNKGGIAIKPFQIKNHMWLFVNALIVNPTFDSQTKENMTLQAKSFGSKCTISDKFINNVSKTGIVEVILTWAKFKADNDKMKTSGRKSTKLRGIPKLEDANDAGTKNSLLCTLILTEGDSAKSLAVSGFGVVGRDLYGVFPLRGKLLNVREATHKQILENVEINNIIKILGLQYKKKYLTTDDLKSLRYGKLMIMTDQDQDGSHIKGLLINFIHTNWPELLRLPFLEEFITPIVKATKKTQELSFYSLPEFEEWKADTPNSNTFNIKYYKGLGTSTSKEAKEYFQNMARHRIPFKYSGSQDDESIIMAFSKKCIEQRKNWLTVHMEDCKRRKEAGLQEQYLYTKDTKEISYHEFINKELVLFSNADNVRSIPCMVDGFKPGQRKVMYTCFKRNDKREVKVAQLSGSVAEQSAYHHGEVSLCMTIVNLAQNYVGSNNINLLEPRGQFGTRLSGGKDSASPRYIFTLMSPLARLIFHPDDDPLLQYQYDDNLRIEPVYYVPIIPMVLINGADGIGTGWSTKIPNHNPRQIIRCLRNMIQGEEPEQLHPYYKNFNGSIEAVGGTRYFTNGNVALLDQNRIEITELPINTWTQSYKENILEPLLTGNDKQKAVISDYKEYHTDTTVRFVISFTAGEFEKLYAELGGFHRVFKLSSSISINSMHAFDANNVLRRYDKANEILKEFYELRLTYYIRRKEYLVGMLTAEADKLSDQARFILEKCNNTLVVENKKRKTMIEELIKRGYKPDPVKEWRVRIEKDGIAQEEEEPADEEEEESPETSDRKPVKGEYSEKAFQKLSDVKKYDYLLGMSMWMLTEERKNELLKQRDTKLSELNILKSKKPEQMWMSDLETLEKKLDAVEENERNEEAGMNKKQAKAAAAASKAAKAAGVLKKRGAGASIGGGSEIYPSKGGVKVEFKMTADLIKKYEKLDAAASAPKRGVAVKKEKVNGSGEGEPIDEFDALVEIGNSDEKKPAVSRNKGPAKDGMKQTTLDFGSGEKPEKPEKDKKPGKVKREVKVPEVRREPVARRAAAKKIDYSLLDSGEEPNNSDEDFGATFAEKSKFSDSDDDIFVDIQENKSTEVGDKGSFDSLKSGTDDNSPVKKKAAAPTKRKLGPKAETSKPPAAKRPKKKIIVDSDDDVFSVGDSSDSDFKPSSKKATSKAGNRKGKKRAVSSSENDGSEDFL